MGTFATSAVLPEGDALDRYLGEASERYFGSGYRRVRYDLRRRADRAFSGSASIGYPADWSVDAEGHQRTPHLSSIDAIVLSALMLERTVTAAEAPRIESQFVSSVDLRAGSSPWERLEDVPITLARDERPVPRVEGTVGNIRVGIDVADSSESVSVAGDGRSVYGDLFQTTECRTVDVHRGSDGALSGRHLVAFAEIRDSRGLEASIWPSLTMVDYMVTLGQMTQALVYSARDLTRATAGPLWMRTMRLKRTREPKVTQEPGFASKARIIRDRVIDRAGKRLHDVQVMAQTSCGVRAASTLAYEEMCSP